MAGSSGKDRSAPATSRPGDRARSRSAAARAEAQRRDRRRTRLRWAITAVVALVVLGGAAVWVIRGFRDAAAPDLAAVSGQGAEQAPPWPAPADVPARAAAAGLQLAAMGTAEHYHVHLDVLVNGQPVAVPTDLGVDSTAGGMSAVHTHTPDGVVHIEATTAGETFTLGQLFTQWDVRLTSSQVGGLRTEAGSTLTVYVNGRKTPGDPAMLRLAPHQEIALVYARAGQPVKVPDSYTFAPGE